MKFECYDNFLPKTDFEKLRNWVFDPNTPWFYHSHVLDEKDGLEWFGHSLYNKFSPQSDGFDLVKPILEKQKVCAIVRIQLNMLLRATTNKKSLWHTDTSLGCKTALYYLNTCNGWTEFESGHKIDCVENRFVEFTSDMLHRGVLSTDVDRRIVLNLNYL